MPRSVASDLGLHCFPITFLGLSRLKWVKIFKWLANTATSNHISQITTVNGVSTCNNQTPKCERSTSREATLSRRFTAFMERGFTSFIWRAIFPLFGSGLERRQAQISSPCENEWSFSPLTLQPTCLKDCLHPGVSKAAGRAKQCRLFIRLRIRARINSWISGK